MKFNNPFYQMFVELLQDLLDAENQIVRALPKIIQQASSDELKKGLSQHLEETREQVNRLRECFNLLGETATTKTCKGLQGILTEGEEVLQRSGLTPAVKDAFIIVSCQKVEHYEIASYGSACALVKHLKAAYKDEDIDFEQIGDLLEETLDEEGTANKKLTTVAEGRMFMEGVNKAAEQELKAQKAR